MADCSQPLVWQRPIRDYVATGTPTKGRGKRTDEGLEIMARLWSEERVNFSGDYYTLDDATIAPKPVQSPLPLWVGGSAAAAIERTARWGAGWQAGIESAAEVAPVITAIKQRAAELGRKIDDDHFGAGFGFRFGKRDEPLVARYTSNSKNAQAKIQPLTAPLAASKHDGFGQRLPCCRRTQIRTSTHRGRHRRYARTDPPYGGVVTAGNFRAK